MGNRYHEIHILGAGISGLVAAITLSGSFAVKVFERSAEIGGGQSHISAVRNYDGEDVIYKVSMMGINLKPSKEIYTVHRYAPSGNISTTFSDKPIFYLFDRGKMQNSIERQLYEQASVKNVEFVFNSKKKNGKIYEGEVNAVSMIYNNDYAPRGYICVLPSKKKFQILAVSFGKNASYRLKERFEKAVVRISILKKIVEGCSALREVKGYGNYFKPFGCKKGVYYVGEAGGFQDPSKGFGIWYAIFTGYLAAKSIIEKEDYNEKIKQLILEEYLINLERRKKLNRLTNQHFEKMIAELGRKVNLEEYVKRRI